MNERIRELYAKALNKAGEDGEAAMIEKFAELIVGECISILYTERGSTHGSERDFAIVNAALKIQRHFEDE